jgi:hypothetical protein
MQSVAIVITRRPRHRLRLHLKPHRRLSSHTHAKMSGNIVIRLGTFLRAATEGAGSRSEIHSSFFRLLDEFAMRQFDDPNYVGTRINMDKTEFMKKVNELVKDAPLRDGYVQHVYFSYQ